MLNMRVLERKEFRERERTNRIDTQRYRGSVMKTYVHTQKLLTATSLL
jgi:hypothetical protein